MKKFSKLVRDNIPDIIRQNGDEPATHIAAEAEYAEKLHAKLREEVEEFLREPSEEELADIREVLAALVAFYALDEDKAEQIQEDKARERGRFDKRIVLEQTN